MTASALTQAGVGISIHAPREGGDPSCSMPRLLLLPISIHAPREGGDAISFANSNMIVISIHAPREGGDIFICATVT